MQPFNYNIETDPFAGATKAFQIIGQLEQSQYIAERRKAEDLKMQMALMQQAEQKAKDLEYNQDILSVSNEPTAKNIAQFALKYPAQFDKAKGAIGDLTDEQKNNAVRKFGAAYLALSKGDQDTAIKIADREIEATKNSGADATEAERIKSLMENNPKVAMAEMGVNLVATMGHENFEKTFGAVQKIDTFAYELRKKAADLGLTEQQTAKLKLETEQMPQELNIKKQEAAVRLMEAQIKREDNVLKREELGLKIQEKRQEVADIKASAAGNMESIDRALGTIDEIKNHKGLNMGTGLTSVMTLIPGTDAKGFKTLVDTFKSQSFLSEISKMKGMGALSEGEGKKLSDAVANLDVSQPKEDFLKQLNKASVIFNIGKKRLEKQYGAEAFTEYRKGREEIITQQKKPQTSFSQTEIDETLAKYGVK